MAAGIARTRELLAALDFKTLFIEEFGWNITIANINHDKPIKKLKLRVFKPS